MSKQFSKFVYCWLKSAHIHFQKAKELSMQIGNKNEEDQLSNCVNHHISYFIVIHFSYITVWSILFIYFIKCEWVF